MLATIDLTKIYTQGDIEVTALDKCNLKIENEEFIAITGTSGSGKSTLLLMCGGMLKPTSGKVFINNEDIYKLSQDQMADFKRRKIGFVFQNYNLLPFMTAKENIIIPSLAENNKYDKEYFNEITEYLKIGNRLNHFPNEMSGGEQQRVAIARALINKPSIIFADEPTGNLDKARANELLDLFINSAKKLKQTVLLITHDLNIAQRTDRILYIENGKIN